MAKSLKDILTGVKSSKTEKPDLKDLAMSPEGNKGELDFAKKHDIEKHDDRVGNDDHIYQGTTKKTTKYKFQKDGVYEETIDENWKPEVGSVHHFGDEGSVVKVRVTGHHDNAIGIQHVNNPKKKDYVNKSDWIGNSSPVKKNTNEETELDEKYVGFEKLKGQLAAKGAKKPGALAAWIGRKKYGKGKFQAAAAKGKKLGEEIEDLDEAGGFSYGYKPPRKGSVAYNAMKKRKENEKNYQPIEPKDQMVGKAKVYKKIKEETECNHSGKGTHCEMHGEDACPGTEPKDMPKKGQKVLLDKKKVTEEIVNEVAPPNPKIEKWIKANKERFIKEYGKEKGTQVLYAKAWKMHGQSESGAATNTDYVGPGAAGWTTGRLDVGTL